MGPIPSQGHGSVTTPVGITSFIQMPASQLNRRPFGCRTSMPALVAKMNRQQSNACKMTNLGDAQRCDTLVQFKHLARKILFVFNSEMKLAEDLVVIPTYHHHFSVSDSVRNPQNPQSYWPSGFFCCLTRFHQVPTSSANVILVMIFLSSEG